MKRNLYLTATLTVLSLMGPGSSEAASPTSVSAQEEPIPQNISDDPSNMDERAGERYNEMLTKMQVAIEEIAQVYGNPVFLQVFTNDSERAVELKERLKAAQSAEDIEQELRGLERKRDDLLNDIALKTREATRLADRVSRQRKALDALAAVIEQAKNAAENSTR
jgi:hypothetical protein